MSGAELRALFDRAIALNATVQIRHHGQSNFVDFTPLTVGDGGSVGTCSESGMAQRHATWSSIAEARELSR